MSETVLLLLTAPATFLGFWLAGGPAVKRLVVAMEGSSEFGHGTTSRLRRLKGYGAFASWMILAALAASYFADWAVHGDPSAAADRFFDRVRVAMYVLEALGED
jgi:hypothetical protein